MNPLNNFMAIPFDISLWQSEKSSATFQRRRIEYFHSTSSSTTLIDPDRLSPVAKGNPVYNQHLNEIITSLRVSEPIQHPYSAIELDPISHYILSKQNKNGYNVNIDGFNYPDYYYDNLKIYWTDLEDQLQLYGARLTVDLEIVKKVALYTAAKVAQLNAKESLLELSPDNSIKFTLIFPEEKMLMINKPLIPSSELDANDIVFSFFIQRDLVSANTNDLDQFIQGFNEYLNT